MSLAALVWAATPASGDGKAPRDAKSREAIDRLVNDLGSDSFDTRESATESLIALGESARPALEEAKKSEDAEVRSRAERCLKEIGGRGAVDERLRDDEEGDSGDDGSQSDDESLFRRLPDFRGFSRSSFPEEQELSRFLDDLANQRGNFGEIMKRLEDLDSSGRSQVSIRIERDGSSWTYTEGEDGTVQATITEPGKEEKKFSAGSRKEFISAYPDLAKKLELEKLDARGGGHPALRGFQLRRVPPGFARTPRHSEPAPSKGRGRMGVAVEDLDSRLRRHLKLSEAEGVAIASVEPGSLASRLGLEPDDIILTLNGTPIDGAESLRGEVGDLRANDPIRLEIIRAGDRQVIEGRF